MQTEEAGQRKREGRIKEIWMLLYKGKLIWKDYFYLLGGNTEECQVPLSKPEHLKFI